MQEKLMEIPVENVVEVKENQPRHSINIDGLAESIRVQGLSNPIIVIEILNSDPQKYRLIDGHRRLAAVRSLKQNTIKAIVEPDSKSAHEAMQALALNVQREQLSQNEINEHLQQKLFYVEPEEIAAASGIELEKVQSYVRGAKKSKKQSEGVQLAFWQLEYIDKYAQNDDDIEKIINARNEWQVNDIVLHAMFLEDFPKLKEVADKLGIEEIFESTFDLKKVHPDISFVDPDECDHAKALIYNRRHRLFGFDYRIACLKPDEHCDQQESREQEERRKRRQEFTDRMELLSNKARGAFVGWLQANSFDSSMIVKSKIIDIFFKLVVDDPDNTALLIQEFNLNHSNLSEAMVDIITKRLERFDLSSTKHFSVESSKDILQQYKDKYWPQYVDDEIAVAKLVIEAIVGYNILKPSEIEELIEVHKAIDTIAKDQKEESEDD